MDVLQKMLEDIPLPRMVRIRQKFDRTATSDVAYAVQQKLFDSGAMKSLEAGQQVAIAVGSRGVANIALVTKTVVDAVKAAGALPFIVPCMGSHGGATAEGQADVLHHLGVDEQAMGAPVRSTMEVVKISELANGLPVYVDKYAASADAIIVINRVKPHTAFRGPIESGIMKMMAIGLGKQKGAEACHQLGFKYMAENVPMMARVMIEKLPILCGVALVENAYDETCRVDVLLAEEIEAREPELLEDAKSRMPKLLFSQMDVLAVDYIGKNISGDGMDPNITGRYPTPYAHGGPDISKIVIFDLTPESKGNSNGVGAADITTQRLVDKTDVVSLYANALTSTVCAPTKIPMTMSNDLNALKAAVKTCNILDYTKCRLVRIPNTLHIGEIDISEAMLEEARQHSDIDILSEPRELTFDHEGNLF